jgi:peptide/nickel transport system ATP-binding protein
MKYFGIDREVRAVDDITLISTQRDLWACGRSSSGKTSFIKTIAAANRPPLNVVGGSVKFSFLDRDIHQLNRKALAAVRWRHLSYIMQGSMNVLNPVRRSPLLLRFRLRHIHAQPEFLDRGPPRRLHLSFC